MSEEVKDKIIERVLQELSELRKKVAGLESLTNDIPTAKQLSAELAGNPMELVPISKNRKRGLGAKPLLESEIVEAQVGAISEIEVARKLGVSYITYRKYATMYNLYGKVKNFGGKGIDKPQNPNKGKYPLSDILEGKYPEYPIFRLKHKLLRSGLKKYCCEQCGFKEHRIIDNKMPLLIVFEDGNSKNHKLENIKILCYNCAFTTGKIWVKCKKREKWINNPDRLLGSVHDTKEYPHKEE